MHLNCLAEWLGTCEEARNPTSCPACRTGIPPLQGRGRSSDGDNTTAADTTDTTDTTDDTTTTAIGDTDATIDTTTDDAHEHRIAAELASDRALNLAITDAATSGMAGSVAAPLAMMSHAADRPAHPLGGSDVALGAAFNSALHRRDDIA